ncbi:unnamed protein product, partial [Protopolystoma xenopodis]
MRSVCFCPLRVVSSCLQAIGANMHRFGLRKRMASAVGGVEGLRKRLIQCHHTLAKPDSLIDCMVKEHILRLPVNLRNMRSLREVYLRSIVRYPILYRMILRRRTIMPQELQHFLSRIMEATDLSDKVLISAAQPCAQMDHEEARRPSPGAAKTVARAPKTSNSRVRHFSAAAKELDASGFLPGGPRLPERQRAGRISMKSQTYRRRRGTDAPATGVQAFSEHGAMLIGWGLEAPEDEDDENEDSVSQNEEVEEEGEEAKEEEREEEEEKEEEEEEEEE